MNKKTAAAALLTTLALLAGGAFLVLHKKTGEPRDKVLKVISMEGDFNKVPPEIAAALALDDDAKAYIDDGCTTFIGERVAAIPKDKNAAAWIATTAEVCGWGAHTAPIWMVVSNGQKQSVVLSARGIGVQVRQARWFGMRDVVVYDGAAAYYTDQRLRFDGQHYNVLSSRFVEADDPDACKKAPDVYDCK